MLRVGRPACERNHDSRTGRALFRRRCVVRNWVAHGTEEVAALFFPLGLLRRVARWHGRPAVQGLRPGAAVREVRQRPLRRPTVRRDHHPARRELADMVALRGKPDIGDQINKKIRGPLAHAKRLADMPDFNDPAKLGSGEGESRAPHEPGRHLRERCPRFLEEPRRGRRLREDAEAIAARRSGSPQPPRAR